MTRRRILRILVPVLGALCATWLVARLTAAPHRPTAALVVAARAIAAGSVIAPADLRTVQLPLGAPLAGGIGRPESAVGEVAQVRISPGAPVLSDELEAPRAAGLAYRIPPGDRAFTVAVNGVSGVGGNLAPGVRVDVLATFPYQSGTAGVPGTPRSTVVAQDLLVLGIGQATGAAVAGSQIDPNYALATLAVTPAQAATVALAEQEGTIDLLLRPAAGAGSGAASVDAGGLGR